MWGAIMIPVCRLWLHGLYGLYGPRFPLSQKAVKLNHSLTRTVAFSQFTLRWRHNDHAGVSNHQPHGCLLNRLFRRKSKKTSKLRVTGLCAGNSPGTGKFPAQMASNAENVSIWWLHHDSPISRPQVVAGHFVCVESVCLPAHPCYPLCKFPWSNFQFKEKIYLRLMIIQIKTKCHSKQGNWRTNYMHRRVHFLRKGIYVRSLRRF